MLALCAGYDLSLGVLCFIAVLEVICETVTLLLCVERSYQTGDFAGELLLSRLFFIENIVGLMGLVSAKVLHVCCIGMEEEGFKLYLQHGG